MSDRRATPPPMRIDAVTLATTDMSASIDFYEALDFEVSFGGLGASFTTMSAGVCHVNLTLTGSPGPWGRVIFHVDEVDALHERAVEAGLSPRHAPRDADWGERMFAITDPSGHDLSFARPL
jgi:catechol 2,3-dioxygenase-like lactoylglutathione lyase family enzyme